MTIISNEYPGLTCVCGDCGALLGYTIKDVYEKKYVYCIICKHKNKVPEIIDAQLVEVKKDGDIKENENSK